MEEEIEHGSIYSLLRTMEVGDRLLAPYELHRSIRPTATVIQKEFGVKFKVTILQTVHGLRYVLTTRLE